MLETTVRERQVADAEELRTTRQSYGGRLAHGQRLHRLLDAGRQHLAGCRIHRGCLAVDVALHDAHWRGLNQQTEKRVLLFQRQVLAAQACQQVVEGAHNEVGLVLPRWCQTGGQVKVLHQFHTTYQRVIGAYGLAIEVAQIAQQHDGKPLDGVKQRGVCVKRRIEGSTCQQQNAQGQENKVMLEFHRPYFSIFR